MTDENKVRVGGVVESVTSRDFKHGPLVTMVLIQTVEDRYGIEEMPIAVETFGKDIGQEMLQLQPGMHVEVNGSIKGRRWEDKVFISINPTRIEVAEVQDEPPNSPPADDTPF
jgi:single-stranded DNA-binding protein